MQEYWSKRRGQGNFMRAWGGWSGSGHFSVARAMPKSYSRIELGLTRRDPRIASPFVTGERVRINTVRSSRPHDEHRALQGASATGGSTVTRRVRVLGTARVTTGRPAAGVMPRSAAFEFGVSVLARMAHANRAYVAVTPVPDAYAHNHRRDHRPRRCTLQNGLPAKSSAAHGVHG